MKLLVLRKMLQIKDLLWASFPGRSEQFDAWLTKGSGAKFHEEVIKFSQEFKCLLEREYAFEDYKEAIEGEKTWLGLYAIKGVKDGGVALLAIFLDIYPRIYTFLLQHLSSENCLLERVNSEYQKTLLEISEGKKFSLPARQNNKAQVLSSAKVMATLGIEKKEAMPVPTIKVCLSDGRSFTTTFKNYQSAIELYRSRGVLASRQVMDSRVFLDTVYAVSRSEMAGDAKLEMKKR